MRGYPEFNQAAFIDAARLLRAAGWEVHSPYEHNISNGLDTSGMSGRQEEHERIRPLRQCLSDDLSWVCLHASAVIVLPGWENSLGVKAEVAAAAAIGIPVITLSEALAGATARSGSGGRP
jgi:hypothetical protein